MRVGSYEIIITRKSIKSIILKVKRDGSIHVSAPLLVDDDRIRMFVESRSEWLKQALIRVESVASKQQLPDLSPKDSLERFRSFRLLLLKKLQYWAPQMGVDYSGLRIKAMTSKWGSCNYKTKVLTFNLYLFGFSERCIDYVVVHELAHLIEPNHSPRFYACVEKYIPDWRECRKQLRGK